MFRYRVVVGGGMPHLPPVPEHIRLDLVAPRIFGSRVRLSATRVPATESTDANTEGIRILNDVASAAKWRPFRFAPVRRSSRQWLFGD